MSEGFPRKPETPEEFKKRAGGYNVKPSDDMTGHGWRKSVTWKYLTIREDNTILCEEYDFYIDKLPFTHECGSNDYLWFAPDRNLNLCCCFCLTSETISKERGFKRKEYIISPEEALKIMLDRGFRESDFNMRRLVRLAKKKRARKIPVERPKTVK